MILIIDNYDSFTYNLYQCVAQIVEDVIVVRNDKMTVREIEKLNPRAIVLSPGPKRPENAGICVELVQKLSGKIPILGVCLGHQAITVAFGGRVIKANEIVHGKGSDVTHDNSIIFNNIPKTFSAARYHSLIAERESLPKELSVIAQNDNGMVMALKHIDSPTYGVQFHPESILSKNGMTLLKNFVQEVSHENLQ